MDPSVVAAMARWPNVPDCRDWLALDRRGVWRLQGKPVTHAGLAAFIGRNYARHESGAWFMQNGPQRVWVTLAATPWVLRLDADGAWSTHTGLRATTLGAAWLVDGESLCLQCEHGLGLVDDRDLPALLDAIRRPDGSAPDEDLAAEAALIFVRDGVERPLLRCRDADLPALGGFRRAPA